jgi:hypothetical protein
MMVKNGGNAGIRWASCFCGILGRSDSSKLRGFTLKIKALEGIRKARFSALGTLLVAGVFIPAASARQAASSGAAQAQPATTKPATATQSTAVPSSPASAGATKSATATHAASAKKHSRRKRAARVRGQKKIDPERARTIQEALIREHYLSGEPTGTWNQASEEAMRRYQSDHGWQTKEVPDSRALISLGLGPSRDHLLNPDSAMTSGPEKPAPTAPAAPPAPSSQTPPAPAPAPNSSQGNPSSPQ